MREGGEGERLEKEIGEEGRGREGERERGRERESVCVCVCRDSAVV